ncbi:52 kDa repressor of the inhibitor of the protein kinase [Holothuria leucospilota]|uniref:52 kDa repressor of the inhibitor of the protein kinase n=1 Tax=Holothuria leucospilota TaxID=206669 RepID=A0A9Q0YLV7_HOLLE|nr:52 kDa repressor of the inhibitor of the protein kinase [Holothuria leucospilota]
MRFVDKENNIREEFVDFVHCEDGVTGEALAQTILGRLRSYGLDTSYLRGQGYDGAGNMSGRIRGTAALIQKEIPTAFYVHCNAHILNLCIVRSCELQPIRNLMGVMLEITIFFRYSPKRQDKLEKKITRICPEEKKSKLINLCKTRWVERHQAFETFADLYVPVVEVFQEITENPSNWNQESLTGAKSLLLAITSFDFLMAFTVSKDVLGYAKGLSTSLQAKNHNICKAMQEVSVVKKSLQSAREQVESKHKEWFQKAKSMAESVNAEEPRLPRKCGRQKHKDNTPAKNIEEHYRVTITVPFLDHMVTQLNDKFAESQQKATLALFLIPSQLPENMDWKELVTMYANDLPFPENFECELSCWKTKWQSWPGRKPTTLEEAMDHADNLLYPNIHILLRIVATLPVTTSECERSFSCLRRLKTYLRGTMTQTRLSGLALMNIHYDKDINRDTVITEFARRQPRRMELVNILE